MRSNFSRCLQLGLAGLTSFVLPARTTRIQSIFDGESGKGWMLCDQKPLPKAFVQPDGLNPHGTGSYLVVHEQKVGDFVLDFDYKLTRGCNSGVFVRVSDLSDPVNTGIEVALDDTTGSGMHDPGAFYDLVAPKTNTQKPAGEWNHMTITARGPKITVVLNGEEVTTIDLDEWNTPGKRPDGSSHKFAQRRDRQTAPHRLFRVPGSRQRLLVQEHQDQVALMSEPGEASRQETGRDLRVEAPAADCGTLQGLSQGPADWLDHQPPPSPPPPPQSPPPPPQSPPPSPPPQSPPVSPEGSSQDAPWPPSSSPPTNASPPGSWDSGASPGV